MGDTAYRDVKIRVMLEGAQKSTAALDKVNAEVRELRRENKLLRGGLRDLNREFAKEEAAARRASAALGAHGAKAKGTGVQVRALAAQQRAMGAGFVAAQPKIEKTATLLSGLSSVAGGAGGKVAAVTGALANIGVVLGSGGLLGIGLTAATFAVGVLAEKWFDVKDGAEAAEVAQVRATDGVIEAAKRRIEQLNADALRLARGTERISQTLTDAISSQEAAVVDAAEKVKTAIADGAAREEVDKLQAAHRAELEVLDDLKVVRADARDAQEDHSRATKIAEKRSKDRRAALKREAAALRALATAERDLAQEREEQMRVEIAAGVDPDVDKARREREKKEVQDAENELNRIRTDAQKDVDKATAYHEDLQRRHKKATTHFHHQQYKERERHVLEYLAVVQSASIAAHGVAMSTLEELVAGNEVAFGQIAGAFLRSIGTQLVGIGVKAIFEGAANSANPYAPGSGAGQIAAGSAAVAAGTALGASGAVMSGISKNEKLGGGTDRVRLTKSGVKFGKENEGGASSFSSGAGAGSGGAAADLAPTRAGKVETHYHLHGSPVFGASSQAAHAVSDHLAAAENEFLQRPRRRG